MTELPDDIDLAWSDADLDAAMTALAGGDAGPARALLAATRTDFDRRELVADVLGEVAATRLDLMARLNAEHRDDPDILLLWGSGLAGAAWNARGSAYAEDTGDDQFRRMEALLGQARSTLRRAAELAPADPVPWARLLDCALGMQADDGECERMWKEVSTRAPLLFRATTVRLQSLAEKWYGSHDQMLAFARDRAAAAPEGHPLHALIPLAHTELYLAAIAEGNAVKRFWKALTHFRKSDWRAEVDAAADRLGQGAAHPRTMLAHQCFAALYYQNDVDDRLAFHIGLSGERHCPWPWGFFGEPADTFARARKQGGLA